MLNTLVTQLIHSPLQLRGELGPERAMDTYRENPNEFDLSAPAEADMPRSSRPDRDGRASHACARLQLLGFPFERPRFPLNRGSRAGRRHDFQANSILLDFTCGRENPAVPYIGAAIREECDLEDDTRTISEVPSRSLLSRLTDHYMQIIANRAPIGFEAEFANQREKSICYRGILMPFSSDGETIDFIYGVINWKSTDASLPAEDQHRIAGVSNELVEEAQHDALIDEPLELTQIIAAPISTFGPIAAEFKIGPMTDDPEPAAIHYSWEDGPLADVDAGELPSVDLHENAGLADRLWAARETADAVKAGEGRTRAALYRALALAYDFALSTAGES